MLAHDRRNVAGSASGLPAAGARRAGRYAVPVARIEDSRRVPASMRRDVRVLGKMLGQVISESDGPDLLADVEDLRHAVIAARQHDAAGQDEDEDAAAAAAADDEIAALVAGWPLERAEAVARAFTVYFH